MEPAQTPNAAPKPPKTPEGKTTQKCQTPFAWILLTLLAVAVAVITPAITKSRLNAQIQALQTQVQAQDQRLETEKTKADMELEQMHNIAFDQGYQLAIWDIYFQSPQYLVQNDDKGTSLWKRQKIDEETQARIDAVKKSDQEKK